MTPQTPTIDADLLHLLLHADGPMALMDLAQHRGMSIDAVQAALRQVEEAGCELHRDPRGGVWLLHAGLGVWVDYLEHRRQRPARVYRRLASTQDAARQMIASAGTAGDGCVVVADEQTAGRGRLGRPWFAPAGKALLFTRAAVTPSRTPGRSPDYSMFVAAVAVAQAVESLCPHLRVQIKWPNDLLIDGRKLAGILVESFHSSVAGHAFNAQLLGIGINVSITASDIPTNLRDAMTSLALAGHHVERLKLLSTVLEALDDALTRRDPAALLSDWRDRSVTMQQRVRLICDNRLIEGRVVDLDPEHGLIVRSDGGELVHLPAAKTTAAPPSTANPS